MTRYIRAFLALTLPFLVAITIEDLNAEVAERACVELSSPDDNVLTRVFWDGEEHLAISVHRDKRTILLPSRIGVMLDNVDLGKKAQLISAERYTIDEQYPWNGNHSVAINRCTGTRLQLETSDIFWGLDIRAYNDGMAFQFSCNKAQVLFGGETTVLNFDPSLTTKYMRHGMGEESRVYTLPVTELSGERFSRTLPPLLLYPQDASHYIMVLEGGGFDFHGYSLLAQKNASFQVDYAEKPEGWHVENGFETGWKIICTVDSLNELVNTDLVPNVCPAPDPKLFPNGVKETWIRPGRSTWNWWARIPCKYEEQLRLIDLAEQIGAEYHLVDIGWDQKWRDETRGPYDYLKQLCDYAAQKDIGIWVWKASDVSLNLELTKGTGKNKFGPLRDVHVSLDIGEMQAEVKRIADAGAKGIKLDYIQSETSKWKMYMERFLKVAAEHKLMVDFHGCPTSAGETRTYPNEVTREAIYGGEKLRGGGGAEKKPTSQYIDLLFTRLIAGHADYTPGIFSRPQGESFTHAMQLASAMMLTSPLLCWADHPQQYLDSEGIQIIRTLPTVWDETRLLNGTRLSDLAVFARRKGKDWYVAGINGYADRRQTYVITLNFLGENKYDALICRDDIERGSHRVKSETRAVGIGDTLPVEMLPSGGFIIRLKAR